MKFDILLVVLLTVVVSRAAKDDDEASQWNDWFRNSIERIQHHKNNLERGLLSVRYALLKEPKPAWKRPGTRVGRSCTASEISSVEVGHSAIAESTVEYQEPHIGTVFQVFSVKDDEKESSESPCDHVVKDDSSSMAMYELLEPVQLDLGEVPAHFFDYAYMPVAMSNHGGSDKGMSRSDGSISVKSQSAVEPVIASLWWQWWFNVVGSPKSRQHRTRYERVGDRAFAAGSHGEIWRGRRRCDEGDQKGEKRCDDKTPLILKRLKIEHGLAVLEAGLREVYIGNMLSKDDSTRTHFTSYVDHFFLEVPRPFVARGISKAHELWIVFEDAGPSLRSYLYTAVPSGEFILYQQSPFWTALRLNAANKTHSMDASRHIITRTWGMGSVDQHQEQPSLPQNSTVARMLMREILGQILSSAAYLHERGIVHRDIKPSNVMCTASFDFSEDISLMDPSGVNCLLGDFSSVWDAFLDENLYSKGPSAYEQTPEYAPPEAQIGPSWIPFHPQRPAVYDSWSIGVLALELLLGTPNVFSVDQRTTALLTNKMQKRGASHEEIQRALYLAALSQFCIFMPSSVKSWPLRAGDPLFNAAMVKQSCTLQDFHQALRARDPLGLGFNSPQDDTLLHLIWKLLAWDPMERITAAEALQHPYFTVINFEPDDKDVPGIHNAIESLELDPRMDMRSEETVSNFTCPKCGRSFADWRSCQTHARSRKHAKFCTYDRSALPTCLNAHSMLPAHPTSGYCDIQGRRPTIEDFHSIQLHPTHQFYGIFDGHTGNLASKVAAATSYNEVSEQLSGLNDSVTHDDGWVANVKRNLTEAFSNTHKKILKVALSSPVGFMDQSGTTATIVYVTDAAIVVANVGDSRAILSRLESGESGSSISAIQLTVDHVASDPVEQKRVEHRGGVVESSGGLARVNGTLAITRSLGDERLSPFLSTEPHVVAMTRQDMLDECGMTNLDGLPCFIVLASDGLWDVMTNQEAVDMVEQVVKQHDTNTGTSWEDGGAFQEASEALTQEAYIRGSSDNIGVCVIAIE